MLIAYQVAVELIVELRPIVAALKQQDSNLADQLQRCASSVVLNLSEGQRRQKGNKHRAYETAHGEAREVLGCLDCARAWGWIGDASEARAKCERLLLLGPHSLEARATPRPTWVMTPQARRREPVVSRAHSSIHRRAARDARHRSFSLVAHRMLYLTAWIFSPGLSLA